MAGLPFMAAGALADSGPLTLLYFDLRARKEGLPPPPPLGERPLPPAPERPY